MSIRVGFMVIGAALIGFTFWSHCAKRLTVDYAVAWSLMGAVLVLMGVIPAFSQWLSSLGTQVEWVLISAGVLLVSAGMHESIVISQLLSKNKELSMQVSLLNQENEEIKAEVDRLTAIQVEEDAEEALVRN